MTTERLLEVLLLVCSGITSTVLMTVIGFACGAVLGLPIALARMSRSLVLRAVGTVYVEMFRALPVIVWLLLIFYGLSGFFRIAPLVAACIGLSLISGAHIAEQYRSGIQSVAQGQHEAAQALGLTPRSTFWRIIAPQGIGVAAPAAATFAVGLLKESAVASVLGVSDVAFMANLGNQQGYPALPAFLIAGVVYLALSVPIALVARFLDHRLRTRVAVVA